jgi:hypothetical protein
MPTEKHFAVLYRGPEGPNIRAFCEEVTDRHLSGEGPLGAMVTKVATQRGLNPDQVERLARMSNLMVFHRKFAAAKSPEERYIEFETAKSHEVQAAMSPRPLGDGQVKTAAARIGGLSAHMIVEDEVDTSWYPDKGKHDPDDHWPEQQMEKAASGQFRRDSSRLWSQVRDTAEGTLESRESARRSLELSSDRLIKIGVSLLLTGAASPADLDYALRAGHPDAADSVVVTRAVQHIKEAAVSCGYREPDDVVYDATFAPGAVVLDHPLIAELGNMKTAAAQLLSASQEYDQHEQTRSDFCERLQKAAR